MSSLLYGKKLFKDERKYLLDPRKVRYIVRKLRYGVCGKMRWRFWKALERALMAAMCGVKLTEERSSRELINIFWV